MGFESVARGFSRQSDDENGSGSDADYDGAGHAFMRSGEDPAGEPANVAARNAAWERMKEILSEL